MSRLFLVKTLLILFFTTHAGTSYAGGSIQNHFTLDLSPLALSLNNPLGSAVGLSYNRLHQALKSTYVLTVETSIPWSSAPSRTDVLASLGFFTEITPAFSIGARVGAITNNPSGIEGFGAIGLRLPALYPDEKQFFGFFFEEIDLGISGAGSRYASFRLGMLLL